MEENDKNKIKSGLEQPSSDFSKNIMRKIDSEEIAMKNILTKHSLDTPSISFADSVVAGIEIKNLTPYKPVISKYVWYGMAAMFVGFSIFMFANTTITDQTISSRLGNVSETFNSLFTTIPYLSYSIMAVLGISALLLLDQRLKRHGIS